MKMKTKADKTAPKVEGDPQTLPEKANSVKQATRNPKLDTVKWDVRARCDIQLMWQITMGDGMDIFQKEKTGLFVNTWTPTEEDMKLLSSRPHPERKNSDEISPIKKSTVKFRVEAPPPVTDTCGKYSCYFDEGSLLYLE